MTAYEYHAACPETFNITVLTPIFTAAPYTPANTFSVPARDKRDTTVTSEQASVPRE